MVIPFHFAQFSYLIVAAVCLTLLILYRLFFYKPTMYLYSLTNFIAEKNLYASQIPVQFFFWIRLISLALMVLLIGKPQLVDVKSKMTLNGIDIVLALDVSGSMALFDDLTDRRTRLDVAKQEALKFIDKRTNDAIGIVIFGRYALARCPITVDKSILKTVVTDLQIGQPSQDMQMMTMLSQGLVTAARRLQSSKAKSKIIVLLTDGAPSPGDLSSDDAITIAKEIGIKIYTIGIGDDLGGYAQDSVFGIQRHQTPLNKKLLKKIATDTGGQFFEAKNPKDLSYIYDKIDKLERNEIESDIYHNYQDYFIPILWTTILLSIVELFIATFVWFIL
jgi:Ca-activated chloride channel family protein